MTTSSWAANGWSQQRINLKGSNRPVVSLSYAKPAKQGFYNPETGSPYKNVPNGDAVRIAHFVEGGTIRLSVFDGVTGIAQDDLPDGHTNPAVYAMSQAAQNIPTAQDLKKELLDLNTLLHDPEKSTISPSVCVSVADVTVEMGTMRSRFLRSGDCETYVFTSADGWVQVLPEDMLTDEGRRLFTELQADGLPEINRVREDFGMDSAEFKKLFAEFSEKEKTILEDSSNWRSLPIGRYDTATLSGAGFLETEVEGVEAVFLTTDGPHRSDNEPFSELLNQFGHPLEINRDFFESRREGWNDMAAGLISFGR